MILLDMTATFLSTSRPAIAGNPRCSGY